MSRQPLDLDTMGDDKFSKEIFHQEDCEILVIDPVEEKKLVRKIDLFLMPSIFVLYLFSFVVSESHKAFEPC